jgi:protein TonB
MFDTVLERGPTRENRWGTGLLIAIILHASALLLAVWLSSHPSTPRFKEEVPLTFLTMPPPPPPPPPKRASTPRVPRVEHRPVPRPDTIFQPREIPKERPAEAEPEKDDGVEGGTEGGVVGGVVGGVIGGVPGGVLGGQGTGPVEFSQNMTPPKKISGPDPEYTRQAMEHEVEGQMLVKCIVTAEGRVHHCRIVQSLPFMDRAVVEALEHRKYTPALFQGRPIDVDYTFKIKMTLPR